MANRAAYLQEMGIDVWVERERSALGSNFEPEQDNVSEAVVSEPAGCAQLDWPTLFERVSSCEACDLHSTRTQTVFGIGSREADLMVIGEAPGAEEDKQGEPFVGRAGQLLNSMLLALGFERKQVFIANILKCRPPNNRDPKPEEATACADYLKRQISLVSPKAILAVGRVAAQNLLDEDTPIGKMRGRDYVFEALSDGKEIPVIVTYHPAYLLRSPEEKRKVWQDLLLLQQKMDIQP